MAGVASLKQQIKEWEREFEQEHGRRVQPCDIKLEPHVHQLYRTYSQAKRANNGKPMFEALAETSDVVEVRVPPSDSSPTNTLHGQEQTKQASDAAKLGSLFRSKTAVKRLREAAEAVNPTLPPNLSLTAATRKLSDAERQRIELNKQQALERRAACAELAKEPLASHNKLEQCSEILSAQPPAEEKENRPRGTSQKARGIGALLRTTSLSKPKVQTPETCRKPDRCIALAPFDTSIDFTCYEVLEPPPHLQKQSETEASAIKQLTAPGKDCAVNVSKFSEELDAMKQAIGLYDVSGPTATDNDLAQRALKQASTYAEKKTHPLERKSGNSSVEKAPVRENYVRMQIGKRKKYKGRGSRSGGCKPMGWSKFGKSSKNKCYACGKTGHWASNCPMNGGEQDGRQGDQLENIVDVISQKESGVSATPLQPSSDTYVVKAKRSRARSNAPKKQTQRKKPKTSVGGAASKKRIASVAADRNKPPESLESKEQKGRSMDSESDAGSGEVRKEEQKDGQDSVPTRTLRARTRAAGRQPIYRETEQGEKEEGREGKGKESYGSDDEDDDDDALMESGEDSDEEAYVPEQAVRTAKRRRVEAVGQAQALRTSRTGSATSAPLKQPEAPALTCSHDLSETADAHGDGQQTEQSVLDNRETESPHTEEQSVSLEPDHSCDSSSPDLLKTLRDVFGHEQFRNGQQEALQRILSGKSTLFVSATGAGKSLCFQLPAMHMKGATLVISPLLSLIQDQIAHMPQGIVGATLNSNQTREEQTIVVEGLKAGKVHVLFVAPERLFTEAFLQLSRMLPPFQLACVDEAHCVSEWAHNFRPSYLRLRSILCEQLKIPTVLALTATATLAMQRDILTALAIPQDGVVRAGLLRENLRLSVSRDQDRQGALMNLLSKDPRFSSGSIIVYCTHRAQAQELANYLSRSEKVEYYHAGRSNRDRQRVQEKFMRGAVRVVVATVAFGMGIDKEDVRGVIHYNCPSSIEGYVQEIGRAGRDGLPAHCHLLFSEEDVTKQKGLARAEGVDMANVRRLIHQVMQSRQVDDGSRGWYAAVEEEQERTYDMSKASMATVLSLLEQHGAAKVCNNVFSAGSVSLLQDKQVELEESSRVVAAIASSTAKRNGQWKFGPCDVANLVGCEPSEVVREMKELAARRLVRVEWEGQSMVVWVVKRVDGTEEEELTSKVYARMAALEKRQVQRLGALSAMLTKAAAASWKESTDKPDRVLAEDIDHYFNAVLEDDDQVEAPKQPSGDGRNTFLRADIISFVNSARDCEQLTGRAVARVFHGLHSHAFIASLWRKNRMWGRYDVIDFHTIQEIADKVIRTQLG